MNEQVDSREDASTRDSVPIWHKYALTIDEAAMYFRIGQHKLRSLIQSNPKADYVLWIGTRPLIKREMLMKQLDRINAL